MEKKKQKMKSKTNYILRSTGSILRFYIIFYSKNMNEHTHCGWWEILGILLFLYSHNFFEDVSDKRHNRGIVTKN